MSYYVKLCELCDKNGWFPEIDVGPLKMGVAGTSRVQYNFRVPAVMRVTAGDPARIIAGCQTVINSEPDKYDHAAKRLLGVLA